MFHLQVVGVILTVFVCACVSFPNRPPISTCEELLPHHDKSISQSLATSPYSVVFTNATYTPGAMMDVRIHGSQRFKGFIIQARAEGSPRPVGTFEGKLADHTRHIWCSGGEPKVGTTWFLNTRPNARAATKWEKGPLTVNCVRQGDTSLVLSVFTLRQIQWKLERFDVGSRCLRNVYITSVWRRRCTSRRCLHDIGTSFILVRNRISYRVYMGVILPEWHEVSCEPSFLQAILERCCLSTRMRYPSQSTRPLIQFVPERNLVPPLHDTGTECGQISYRYERFVPVREPEWTRTGMTRTGMTFRTGIM